MFAYPLLQGGDHDLCGRHHRRRSAFSTLVSTVSTLAEAGQSFATSDQVVSGLKALYISVAPKLQSGALSARRQLKGSPSAKNADVSYGSVPITVMDGLGTDYTLINQSFTWFAGISVDAVSSDTVAVKLVDRRDLNPFYFSSAVWRTTIDRLVGVTGAAKLPIDQVGFIEGQGSRRSSRPWIYDDRRPGCRGPYHRRSA